MAQRVEVPFEPPIRRVVWAGGEDVAAAMVYLLCCLEVGRRFYVLYSWLFWPGFGGLHLFFVFS